jgi:hypothetical protein
MIRKTAGITQKGRLPATEVLMFAKTTTSRVCEGMANRNAAARRILRKRRTGGTRKKAGVKEANRLPATEALKFAKTSASRAGQQNLEPRV